MRINDSVQFSRTLFRLYLLYNHHRRHSHMEIFFYLEGDDYKHNTHGLYYIVNSIIWNILLCCLLCRPTIKPPTDGMSTLINALIDGRLSERHCSLPHPPHLEKQNYKDTKLKHMPPNMHPFIGKSSWSDRGTLVSNTGTVPFNHLAPVEWVEWDVFFVLFCFFVTWYKG